jgi:uncharacterized protein YqhQ
VAGEQEILVGGQAVLEGVMMKMPRSWAVTVRRASGELVSRSGPIAPWSERLPILKIPILRGVAVLGQMMVLGMRSLSFSADVAAQDEQAPPGGSGRSGADVAKSVLTVGSLLVLSSVADGPQGDECDASPPPKSPDRPTEPGGADAAHAHDPSRGGLSSTELTLTLVFAFALFVVVFKALPLGVAWLAGSFWPALKAPIAESLISGVALLVIFIGYLLLMSRIPDIRRVFQYHGAEHEVVHNHESGLPITVENARTFPTLHPRCGTSFLFFVVLTSIVVWSLFPLQVGFLGKLALRLALLPLIVGLSFELIRLSSRHRSNPFFKILMAPGLWSQRITTKQPDDGMLEVSIFSLAEADRSSRS